MLKGARKPKKLTAKQLEAENNRLELQNAMLKMKLDSQYRNYNIMMACYEGIFIEVLRSSGTKKEAEIWYQDFATDINALDLSDVSVDDQIKDIMSKHGFTFNINDHYTEVDSLWE